LVCGSGNRKNDDERLEWNSLLKELKNGGAVEWFIESIFLILIITVLFNNGAIILCF